MHAALEIAQSAPGANYVVGVKNVADYNIEALYTFFMLVTLDDGTEHWVNVLGVEQFSLQVNLYCRDFLSFY